MTNARRAEDWPDRLARTIQATLQPLAEPPASPGGHRATTDEKRAAYGRYETAKRAFYAGQADAADLPQLLASGQADGYVSPLIRKIYGL
jgi:hypothetical protein